MNRSSMLYWMSLRVFCSGTRGHRPSRRTVFGPTFEVRAHLLEVLAWQTPPVIDSELPAYTQFAHCFPRRCDIPFRQLLSGVLPRAPRGPERPRDEAAEDGSDSGEVRSWKVRLRPRLFGRAVVAKAKPNPDIYQKALSDLRLHAQDCMAIEDTVASMNSALAAGIACIGFPGAFAEAQDFKGAVIVTDELSPNHLTALNV